MTKTPYKWNNQNSVYLEQLLYSLCQTEVVDMYMKRVRSMQGNKNTGHMQTHHGDRGGILYYKNPLSCNKRAIFSSSRSRGSLSKLRFQK